MPTLYELSKQKAVEDEDRMQKNHQGIRAKGAVFIREPGKKLPPYIQAQKNQKRMLKSAEEEKAHRQHQEASAQGQRAMVLMDLKKQGIEGAEAERIADEKYKESMGVRKTKAQKEFEMRVNTEAEQIFKGWDDDGDGSLNPAELRQALALAGFNTGTDYVEQIMDEFDTDGDGMMDMDEFKVMMHVLYTGQRKKGIFDTIKSLFQDSSHAIFQHDVLTDREIEKYKQIFYEADDSGDMLLDEGELEALLVSKGFMHGQREFVFDTMRTMDASGDGAIDFGEFLEFMTKIKEKRTQANQAQFLSLSFDSPEPPPPLGTSSGYFKVARFVPLLAPTFEKRWVHVEDGMIFIAETRSGVKRLMARRGDRSLRGGRAFDEHAEVIIDCAYIDEVRTSETGNAAGTKFELTTLSELWYFKSDNKEACEKWKADLVVWRDHTNYVLYRRNYYDIFADASEEAAAAAAAKSGKASLWSAALADAAGGGGGVGKKGRKKKRSSRKRQGTFLESLGLAGGEASGGVEATTGRESASVRPARAGSAARRSAVDNPLSSSPQGSRGRGAAADVSEDGESTVDHDQGGSDEEADDDPDSGTDEEEGDF